MAEHNRHGLATKTTLGGAGGLGAVAIIDALANGAVDSDTRAAVTLATILAIVAAAGKFAQAVAEILARGRR